jgi:lysophospholipase L1-like esterase
MKLVVIGDCNTLGVGAFSEPAEFSYPMRLASLFRQSGETVDLLSMGLTMSTTREGIAQITEQKSLADADVCIINYGLVDAWVTSIPSVYVPYYPETALRKFKRKMLKSVKRRLRSKWMRRFIQVGEVVPIEEYQANLRRMVELLRKASPRAFILFWGSMPTRDDDERNQNLCRYNVAMQEVTRACHVNYLDSKGLFTDAELGEQMYSDAVHLGADVHQRLADAMYALWSRWKREQT